MTTENKTVIASALDTLQLFNMLAAEFRPRTHKQIVELAAANGRDWTSTKVFGMLQTLQAGQFLRQIESKEWTISPHVTAIAVAYHESIIRRCRAITADTTEIKTLAEERIS